MVELLNALTIDRAALARESDRLIRGVLRAGKGAIAEATRGLERNLEEVTRSAVPGRLWRAWKSETYPRGSGIAREPQGVVWINGGARSKGAMTFFSKAGTIRGSSAYLAIPTPAAGPRGRKRDLSPGDWERRTGLKLRFVYRRNAPSLLVLDEGRLAGKKQVAKLAGIRARAKGHTSTVVIFILVPVVQFANRFSIAPIVRRWESGLSKDFVQRVKAIP